MSRIGYHTAGSTLQAIQTGIDITGNNLANVNTNGFKASRADFADLIYTERRVDTTVQTGHGVRIDKSNMQFEQSIIKETGRMLDFAALDEGLFAVETTMGDIRYTKDGSFYYYAEDGYLHDSNGGYVLDYDGNRIVVPFIDFGEGRSTEEVLDENGFPTGDEENALDLYGGIDFAALKDMVGVYTVPNPYGLEQIGMNYFAVTASSGEAEANAAIRKKQGYVENSSTNIATEMVRAIEYQRAFQLNANMVKTHNELEERINSLR